jgi:hypothetical protein
VNSIHCICLIKGRPIHPAAAVVQAVGVPAGEEVDAGAEVDVEVVVVADAVVVGVDSGLVITA